MSLLVLLIAFLSDFQMRKEPREVDHITFYQDILASPEVFCADETDDALEPSFLFYNTLCHRSE